MVNIFYILIAVGFVLLNGFFVLAEFSMVKLRHSRIKIIKQEKGFKGRILFKIHHHLDAYLSACQLGITLASLGLGWVGEPAFAELLEPLLHLIGFHSQELIHFTAFIVAFSIISFLHIVIGELMPKSMAIRQSEHLSLLTAIPLYLFYWTMYPFIWLLNSSANILLAVFNLDAEKPGDNTYSAEEIKFILKSSHLTQPLNEKHRNILLHMLEFAKLQAVDAMRPLDEMVSINNAASWQEKLAVIQKHQFTRYPVYDEMPDNIIGVLHVKDMLISGNDNSIDNDTETKLREIVSVSHHAQAIETLEKFQQGKPHFALVYDKAKLIGFMTLDNLLQTLIGKIRDEFHLVKEHWKQLDKNQFLIKGSAPVYAIEKLMHIDFSHHPADTVADLVELMIGKQVKKGDHFKHPQFTLYVHKTTSNHQASEVILIPTASST